MREVVLIPAWRRADFLHATLMRLWQSDIGDIPVHILIDRGPSAEVLAVAGGFAAPRPQVTIRVLTEHGYRGNSYNVLTGYQDAVADGFDLIHLVEEDVFIGRDYFDAHRRAHQLAPDVFAVSLARNHGLPIDQTPPPRDGAIYLYPHYQSLAVSLRAERLRTVLDHAHAGYFLDMHGYCRRTFPGTSIQAGHCEQDGLLNRVREAQGLKVAYAAVPRAYHAGFIGINRLGLGLVGTIPDRAAQLLAMDEAGLNQRARQHRDHTTIDLDADRAVVEKILTWP
jgi:hypothetical protein